MTVSLHTPSKPEAQQITLHPSLYPSPETVQKLLSKGQTSAFFSSRSFASLQVGVSGCGGLVAIALGVNVHVYLSKSGLEAGAEGEQGHAEVSISSNITDSVRSVEFVDNDQLLRVKVDGREGSYVRYLGFRKCSCLNRTKSAEPVSVSGEMKLKYWTVALRRVHLDSRSIEEGLGGGVSTRGMRLLPPAPQRPQQENEDENVHCTCRSQTNFFTLLCQPGCKNIYAVGKISTTANAPSEVKITQQIPSRAVTPADIKSYFQLQPVLREGRLPSPLPSPLSSPLSTPDGSSPGSGSQQLDRFDKMNLPQAHCLNPVLTVSDDGRVLGIYEQPHGKARGAIYLCWRDDDSQKEDSEKASVVAWPFIVSTVDQSVHSLRVTAGRESEGYVVDAESQRHSMQWRLCRS
ncbi:hypothetical protein BDW69DRAFT_175674 [Aspergillus filifer]